MLMIPPKKDSKSPRQKLQGCLLPSLEASACPFWRILSASRVTKASPGTRVGSETPLCGRSGSCILGGKAFIVTVSRDKL